MAGGFEDIFASAAGGGGDNTTSSGTSTGFNFGTVSFGGSGKNNLQLIVGGAVVLVAVVFFLSRK